jgi:hypothetical protein
MKLNKIRILILLGVIATVTGIWIGIYKNDSLLIPTDKLNFDGDSQNLKATKVVPVLDATIDRQTNLIWCASFLAAWKALESDVVNSPPSLQGSPKAALDLNNESDPKTYIPKESLYATAGWSQKGITEKIKRDLSQKFPAKLPPEFPGIATNSFVAYAYLEAGVKFALPYFQNPKPLMFTDQKGIKTQLSSFGIRPDDDYAYYQLREQPQILYEKREKNYDLIECIVDLDHTSLPNQIILAMVTPESTLRETLSAIDEKINKNGKKYHHGLGPNDVLIVPDIMWRISHRFAQLENREFTNANMKGQRLDVAQQDIQFCLNRSGAELKAEDKILMLPIPTYYVFDRPFLLQMKKRGAQMPYFVMWVENAELINKWQPAKSDSDEIKQVASSNSSLD